MTTETGKKLPWRDVLSISSLLKFIYEDIDKQINKKEENKELLLVLEVKKPTLISIKKEIDKCYNFISKNIINYNNKLEIIKISNALEDQKGRIMFTEDGQNYAFNVQGTLIKNEQIQNLLDENSNITFTQIIEILVFTLIEYPEIKENYT